MAGLVLREHWVRVRLALGRVGGCDGVDDALRLFVSDLLIVVDYIAQMVLSAVMRPADRHGVVREVDIAVVACRVVSRKFRARARGRKSVDREAYRRL